MGRDGAAGRRRAGGAGAPGSPAQTLEAPAARACFPRGFMRDGAGPARASGARAPGAGPAAAQVPREGGVEHPVLQPAVRAPAECATPEGGGGPARGRGREPRRRAGGGGRAPRPGRKREQTSLK